MAIRARLDAEMVGRGLAKSREGAQRLIMAGRVRVDSRPALKADLRVTPASEIIVVPGPREYASRGAHKLIAALDAFKIDVAGRDALDVGASNGGFTDVLLRRGVARLIALDVGYAQLDAALRADPRVTVLDRTNIRLVRPDDLPYNPDLIVIDVSFISLQLVLPVVIGISATPADIIALVKPQFEAGRGRVGKGGVIRSDSIRREMLEKVLAFASEIGLYARGSIESPIAGAAGNREFLTWFRKNRDGR
jgi:23S rRNA (cytidine1920-2'-O)/16S rRNA (cytidine1409-2'-O)-methyltransferase